MPRKSDNHLHRPEANGGDEKPRSLAIRERLEAGESPYDLMREGYPRSTVYRIYQSVRQTRKDIHILAKTSVLEDVAALDELHAIVEGYYDDWEPEARRTLALVLWDRLASRRELQGAVSMLTTLTQGFGSMAQALASERSQEVAAAVHQLGGYLEQRLDALEHRRKDIAEVPNPLAGLAARTMERVLDRILNQVFPAPAGGPGQGEVPGFTRKVVTQEEGQ